MTTYCAGCGGAGCSETVSCALCDGTGDDLDADGELVKRGGCDECNGDSLITTKCDRFDTDECPECDGYGNKQE